MEAGSQRREQILNAAVGVFGKFGFKKTSVDDLAAAAGISKQGLYLHFSSKEEVFLAGLQRYLDDCLSRVQQELTKPGSSLLDRLVSAMDAWFGRHLATFTPESFDVIEASKLLAGDRLKEYESAFQAKLTKALPTTELPNWLVRLAALRDPAIRLILPELGKYKNGTNEKAKRILGWTPRSNEDSILATAESLIRLGLLKG